MPDSAAQSLSQWDIQEALEALLDPAKRETRFGMLSTIRRIECANGFTLSVQASEHHYCSPRNNEGPWTQLEVGFPSKREEVLMPYIDGGPDEDPTETVYGYVPIRVVAYVIAKNGGFAKVAA